MKQFLTLALAILALGSSPANADRLAAPKGAYAYIGWPNDGEVFNCARFRVWLGLRHMGIAPAGVKKALTGHHHLVLDAKLPAVDEEIPNDRNNLHYGKGQSEIMLSLPPGRHTLQLLLGDDKHVPHDPPVKSRRISFTCK